MRIASLTFALALVAACGGKKSTESSGSAASDVAPTGPSPTEEARTLFKTVCSTCHGEDGSGNGSAAAALNPKPQNYTDKAWQAKVTDDEIKKAILQGGAAVGRSAAMPAQTQLRDKPEVVDALVRIVRSFGK
jgi:cytochrome c553